MGLPHDDSSVEEWTPWCFLAVVDGEIKELAWGLECKRENRLRGDRLDGKPFARVFA